MSRNTKQVFVTVSHQWNFVEFVVIPVAAAGFVVAADVVAVAVAVAVADHCCVIDGCKKWRIVTMSYFFNARSGCLKFVLVKKSSASKGLSVVVGKYNCESQISLRLL